MAIETDFIHKGATLKILRMTESELMTSVSNGEIKGFDRHRQPVQHWGRYHAGQTDDDRLPGAMLQWRVSYFDRGDVLYFADQRGIAIGQAPAAEVVIPNDKTPAAKPRAENYLQRNSKHWAIKFQDEYNAHFDHLAGLSYIAHILNRPGESIADLHLYSLRASLPC